jgi:uncharacterized membrane protein
MFLKAGIWLMLLGIFIIMIAVGVNLFTSFLTAIGHQAVVPILPELVAFGFIFIFAGIVYIAVMVARGHELPKKN